MLKIQNQNSKSLNNSVAQLTSKNIQSFLRTYWNHQSHSQNKDSTLCIFSKTVAHRYSIKKTISKNFAKFVEKDIFRSFFLIKLEVAECNFIKKETSAQVFSCELYNFLQNNSGRMRIIFKELRNFLRLNTNLCEHRFQTLEIKFSFLWLFDYLFLLSISIVFKINLKIYKLIYTT